MNLLLSTILMLKKSILKDYLFKVMKKLNKLQMNFNKHDENEMCDYDQINQNIIHDVHIILENIDEWIRHYNSESRMSMKRELSNNLIEIKNMFIRFIS